MPLAYTTLIPTHPTPSLEISGLKSWISSYQELGTHSPVTGWGH